MARCDVLVSADWAESNLHAPKVVFIVARRGVCDRHGADGGDPLHPALG